MQTMPKSNTPIQGGGGGGGGRNDKHRPHSNNQRNRSGSNGSGSNNDNPLAKRRTSQESSTRQQNNRSRREESNNDTKSLKRSFTKGDKLTKLMSSKLPPTLFSVASGKTSDNAANGVNRGKDTYRDTSDRSKQQSPPPKHWKEASRSTSTSAGTSVTSASVASTASASESHMSSKLGAALLSINKRKPNNSNSNKNNTSRSSDNDTFDTYSTGNDSGTYDSRTLDSRTYDSGMSTLSVGSESYTSYASGSYVSRASKGYTRWKSKRGARTSDGRSSGDGRDKLYVRRYAKIVLGVVGLAAMRLIGERNGNDGRMSWEEWDPKWGTRMIQEEEQVAQVNKLRARRLPQVQGDIAPAAPDIVSNPPIQEVGNQIIESDWEVRLRSWKSPEDEEDDDDEGEDEWDPKWDPKPVSSTNIYPFNPQDTTKVEAAATPNNNPTTTSQQVKPKGKNDALFALREKNRLEHLENWKD